VPQTGGKLRACYVGLLRIGVIHELRSLAKLSIGSQFKRASLNMKLKA
jgi:hypothetical protein